MSVKRIINGSQVARNALYKSAGRGKKKDETISFWSVGQFGRPLDFTSIFVGSNPATLVMEKDAISRRAT